MEVVTAACGDVTAVQTKGVVPKSQVNAVFSSSAAQGGGRKC